MEYILRRIDRKGRITYRLGPKGNGHPTFGPRCRQTWVSDQEEMERKAEIWRRKHPRTRFDPIPICRIEYTVIGETEDEVRKEVWRTHKIKI